MLRILMPFLEENVRIEMGWTHWAIHNNSVDKVCPNLGCGKCENILAYSKPSKSKSLRHFEGVVSHI
jgi:hypothetical protein